MAAKASDWKTFPLPDQRMRITLGRAFDSVEMARIRNGLVPEEMEDKWFIYYQDDTLYLHRSWTGYCIYVVRFVEAGEGVSRMTWAEVNGDTTQYHAKDAAEEVAHLHYLIDLLLLQRHPEYPDAGEPDSPSALSAWSDVGRAYLGILPQERDQ